MNNIPSKNDIIEAQKRINKFAHKTPVLTSQNINEITGSNLFFKCENFQKVGAFKFRGAINAISTLSKDELSKGVCTHSSGNHAAALALAANLFNTKAFIVMPDTAPKSKISAVKSYGANVIFSEATLESREEALNKIVKETEAHYIPPFNDVRIVAGQGTSAKELIEEIKNLEIVIAPVGGGGLLSGTSLSAKYFGENITVIGAEPKGADDAFRSFRDNKIYPSVNPQTICDGLLTSLKNITFPIIKENVNEIITAKEESIIEAMKLIWQRMKIIIEPSAAVPLAVVLENKEKFANKKVGIIISGGNVDFDKLPF